MGGGGVNGEATLTVPPDGPDHGTMTPALTISIRDEIRSLSIRADPWDAAHNLPRVQADWRKEAAARRDGRAE